MTTIRIMNHLPSGRATRWISTFLACAAAFLVYGCTTIVDLDEDCAERNACAAFRCAQDNVACKSSCSVDRDCSLGASCRASTCEYSECVPNFSRAQIGSFDDDIESAAILNLSHIGVYVAIVEAGDRLFEIAMNVEDGRIVNQTTSIISDGPSADFVFDLVQVGEREAVALWSRARTRVSSLKLRRYEFPPDGETSVVFADVPFGDASDLLITSVSLESAGEDGLLVVNTNGFRPEVYASEIEGESISPLIRQHVDGFAGRFGTAHRLNDELLVAFLESDSTDWRGRVRSATPGGVDVVFAGARLPTPLNFATFSAFGSLFRAVVESGRVIGLEAAYPNADEEREVDLASGSTGIVGVFIDDSDSALGELVLGEFPNGVGLYFRYLNDIDAASATYTRVVEATTAVEISEYSLDESADDVAVFWAERPVDLNRSSVYVSSFSCR